MSLTPLTTGLSSDKKTLAAAMQAVLRFNDLKFEVLLPAVVLLFDRARNVATVQPLITWVDVNDNARPRARYTEIPVMSSGGGGFHISFPLKAGDLGWIYASDRDLGIFRATLQQSKPNTGRCHRFEDGMFIPDVFRKYVINGEDTNAMVIQSVDGATRVSIRPDNIKMTASLVTIDAPTAHFTGNVTVDKTLTATVDAVVAGISVKGHGHISSALGNRTAGAMIA